MSVRMAKAAFAAVVLAAVVVPAGANTVGEVELRAVGVDPGKIARIYLDGRSLGRVRTGQVLLQLDPSHPGTWGLGLDLLETADASNIIPAFCIDLTQYSSRQFHVYDVVPLIEAPKGGSNSDLFPPDGGMGAGRAADLLRLYASSYSQVVDDTSAAAFQMAVWEIVFEASGAYDVSNSSEKGTFFTTTDQEFVDTANDWLSNLGSDDFESDLYAVSNPWKQDFAVLLPPLTTSSPPIPEPLTIVGALLSVGGVAGYIRARRRAKP